MQVPIDTCCCLHEQATPAHLPKEEDNRENTRQVQHFKQEDNKEKCNMLRQEDLSKAQYLEQQDCKACMRPVRRPAREYGGYLGEDASEEDLEGGLLQALVQGHQAQVLRQVLEQDLDEDTAAGGGVLLSQADASQHRPADGVCRQQVLHSSQPTDTDVVMRERSLHACA